MRARLSGKSFPGFAKSFPKIATVVTSLYTITVLAETKTRFYGYQRESLPVHERGKLFSKAERRPGSVSQILGINSNTSRSPPVNGDNWPGNWHIEFFARNADFIAPSIGVDSSRFSRMRALKRRLPLVEIGDIDSPVEITARNNQL